MPPRRSSMRKLADKSAQKTDEALQDRELQLLLDTSVDWATLRPQIDDKDLFDKLKAEVQKATAANESVAALKARIESLGSAGASLAKKIVSLM